jgi:tRNA dimethylallyltransferase
MRMSKRKINILAIVGQTASGKSTLAIKLATLLNGEIISADSRQVYKGMDIGSGKVTNQERRVVPHHLLDVASPKRNYTVAHFVRDARISIKTIARNNKLPIICGGTGFWVDTLLYDLPIAQVPPHPSFRKKMTHLNVEQLFTKLKKLNPRRARTIDQNNPVRLIRAIEVETFGTLPNLHKKNQSPYSVTWIGLHPQDCVLKTQIHRRLMSRFTKGMVQEVRHLHASGVSWKRLEKFGLEYRDIAQYLQHKTTKQEMILNLEKNIRAYAKRQMTWFKRNNQIMWFSLPSKAFAYCIKNFKKNL